MKYLPFGGVAPLTKKPEDSGYEIGVLQHRPAVCSGEKRGLISRTAAGNRA